MDLDDNAWILMKKKPGAFQWLVSMNEDNFMNIKIKLRI